MKFGEFIEMVMWYKRINKTEFAKQMNTSITSIDRMLHDSINLTPMKMQKLSKVIGVPLEILFMWQGHELANRYSIGVDVAEGKDRTGIYQSPDRAGDCVTLEDMKG